MSRRTWVGLVLLVLLGVGIGLGIWLTRSQQEVFPIPAPPGVRLLWSYESPHRGGFVASPTLHENRLFATALHARGFRYAGAIYALDAETGQLRWSVTDEQQFKPSASAVAVAGDRLYVGEGMHGDFVCQLRCLDRLTGRVLWRHEAHDHIEAAPTVQDGVVYCSAGNDGVYALDAETGRVRWHFTADLHTDAKPCVHDGRVFVGTGPSRRYPTRQVVALNAVTGEPLWRIDTDLPAWGSPVATDDRLFVGLGNGRMMQSAAPPEQPAGALLCLNPETGQELWRIRTEEAVFQQPTLAGEEVVFASRDGLLRRVRQADGQVHFTVPIGAPQIASPTVVGNRIYTVSVAGLIQATDRETGQELWRHDLAAQTESKPLFFGAIQARDGRLFLAGELGTPSGSLAVIYCFAER